MADQMIDVVFKFCPAHLEFLGFLVGSEIDFLLDAVNGVIEPMIFVEHFTEMFIGALEASDGIAMLRKLSEDGMMQVHNLVDLDF